ncbi:MAG: EF-P 5-aminopentanol modification-associated protein YfmH [Clostridia bacterium]
MQIIENSKVKEKLYIEKLENGLTIMIMPKKGIQKKYVIWATNYGSIDNKFIVPGENEVTEVPEGVAHYLEHKMFEQESGKNSLDTLTQLGVDANAYTTTNHTAYLFECTDNFYPALDELMDYVQHPYFTDENVEKEKGIISQEIMMYDDYPEWVVYMNAIRSMYEKNPITIDIAGTVDSIKAIDKEVLYKCYNTFYNLSNMVMCVVGDFVPEELVEEIKKRIVKNEKSLGEIKRIREEEPAKIVRKEISAEMEVSMPLFVIGIKDTNLSEKEDKESVVKKHIAIEILLNMLIGKSSKTYKGLYEQGIIMSEPYLEYEFEKTYAHVAITGQSKEPKKVLEAICNQIKRYKEDDLDEEHFNRIKNMIYGGYIKEYNDVAAIGRMFISDYFKGINSFDYLENFSQVTKEYAENILKEVFKEENMVISIVRGK